MLKSLLWIPLKHELRYHLRIYLKSTALSWKDALFLALSKHNSPTFWGWTQNEHVAVVSLAISQRWIWELQVGCYPSDVPAWSLWPNVFSLHQTAFCRCAKRRMNHLPALQDRLMQRSHFCNQKLAAREEKHICESCCNYFKTACGKKIRCLWIGGTECFPSSWGEDVLILCGCEMQILVLLLILRRINCVYHFRIRLITVGVFRFSIFYGSWSTYTESFLLTFKIWRLTKAVGFTIILSLDPISSTERKGLFVFPQVRQEANNASKRCSYSTVKKLSKWSWRSENT